MQPGCPSVYVPPILLSAVASRTTVAHQPIGALRLGATHRAGPVRFAFDIRHHTPPHTRLCHPLLWHHQAGTRTPCTRSGCASPSVPLPASGPAPHWSPARSSTPASTLNCAATPVGRTGAPLEEGLRVAICAPPCIAACAALVVRVLVPPPPQLYCAAAAVGRTVPPREEGAFATWGPRPCDPIGSGGATVAVDGQAPPPPLRGGAAGEAGVTAPPWSPRHLRSGRFAVRASDGRTAPPSCGSLVAHRPRCGHSRASLVAARRPRFVAAPPLPEGRVHCSRPCRGGAVFPRIVSVAARFSRLVYLFSGRPYCRRGWGPSPLASAARVEAALPWILGGRTASAAVVQTASLRAAAQNGSRSVWSRAPLWSTCCWWLFRATLG